MLMSFVLAAAFIVNDRYEPSAKVAWLCPEPEAAAEIGVKDGAAPGLVSALAQARGCVSWEAGALNVRDAKRVGAQEVGLIRVVLGSGPEITHWVARNTVQWAEAGKSPGAKP